ncbi:HGSNAT [Bugula neritina]|uniref:HGSNAT n=1 Tax=Bugula neritina TaxID=10212 RepID=A0A7J7J111_BUGNE|nr:HGSNAT [Bugula neritina]
MAVSNRILSLGTASYVVLTLSILLLILPTGQASLGIDQSILEISVTDYNGHGNISVLARNTDCWKCKFIEIGIVPADPGAQQNLTLYANHSTRVKLSLIPEDDNSSEFLCQKKIDVTEHAYYQLMVSSSTSGEANASCELITIDEGKDGYMPILYMFLCLTGLALLWILIKLVLRCNYCRFSDSSVNDALVQSDLGSTHSVSTGNRPETKKSRIKSLDAFRGLSLTIMIFVNYGGGKYWFFAHSAWNGLTVADLVFPWFVFIMGTALAFVFSLHHRKGKSKLQLCIQIIIRCIKLFVLGLMVNSTSGNDLSKLRIPGVLQRFSLTYLVVALTELTFSYGYTKQVLSEEPRWYHSLRDVIYFWPSWLIALTLLALHTIVTLAIPYDMNGCPTGYIGPGGISEEGKHFNCTGGIAKYIDLKVFTQNHIYQYGTCKKLYQCSGTDPEGLLGTLTSIFLCFLGVQAGRILVTYTSVKARITRWITWAVVLGAIALLLTCASQNEGWIPLNKNLWSASFVIALAAMAYFLLCFLYVVIDVKEYWTGAPFIYPGMNSIFIYMGSETLGNLVPVSFLVSNTHLTQLFMNLWSTTFWVLVAAYMHYKNIFINV